MLAFFLATFTGILVDAASVDLKFKGNVTNIFPVGSATLAADAPTTGTPIEIVFPVDPQNVTFISKLFNNSSFGIYPPSYRPQVNVGAYSFSYSDSLSYYDENVSYNDNLPGQGEDSVVFQFDAMSPEGFVDFVPFPVSVRVTLVDTEGTAISNASSFDWSKLDGWDHGTFQVNAVSTIFAGNNPAPGASFYGTISSMNAVTVPEPSGVTIAILALGGIITLRRPMRAVR